MAEPSIVRTTAGSARTNITPTNLVGDDPTARLTGFTSYGASQLWFSATEAENVTSLHLRGFAIEHSANGGLTWSWTGVPTCSTCSMSLSFVSSTLGWALGSNGNLYETTDAGTRWTLQPATVVTATATLGAIDFVNASSGWLSTGRELTRPSDAAQAWTRVTCQGSDSQRHCPSASAHPTSSHPPVDSCLPRCRMAKPSFT